MSDRRERISGLLRIVGFGVGLSAMLFVAGCTVGPNYTAPEVTAPEKYDSAGPGIRSGATIEAAWWRTFNDPRLDALVERAIANNRDLRAAVARVREARAQRGIADSARIPQINSSGGFSRSRRSESTGNGFGDTGPRNLFDAAIDAGWEIDVFGSVARGVEAADADIGAAEENRRDVVVTLLSEVARNYAELRGFQSRIELANKNVEVQTQTLELTRSRFKAGLTNDLDVAQAEALLSTTKAAIPPLMVGARASSFRLAVLVGEQPQALLQDLSAIAPVPPVSPDVPVGLPSELLLRRPDVRRSERELAAQTARIGEATADLFPRFSLTGEFGFQSSKGENWFSTGSRFWSFGPGVRWPIFQGGRIRSNIRVQEARTEALLAGFEQTVLLAFEDTENALTQYEKEKIRRDALADAVRSNERAVTLSEQLYKNGVADFQRVLDSQRNLFLAQDSLAASQTQVTTSLVRLYKALGGGWDVFEAPSEPPNEQPQNLPAPATP
jgi:outer membrane protein, multidrug efflux system